MTTPTTDITVSTDDATALAALVREAADTFLTCDIHADCRAHRANVSNSPFEAGRRDGLLGVRRRQADARAARIAEVEAGRDRPVGVADVDQWLRLERDHLRVDLESIDAEEEVVQSLYHRVDPDNDADPLTLFYVSERERTRAAHDSAVVAERVALTPRQAWRAHALARFYGHTWGFVDLDSIDAPLTPAAIAAACGETATGITAPSLDHATGEVVHTTFSGRTSWAVRPDGRVTITITRPAGDVIAWAEQADAPPTLTVADALPVYVRHVAALVMALDAIDQAAWVTSAAGRALLAAAVSDPDGTVYGAAPLT